MSKSCAMENVSSHVLKDAFGVLILELAYLFNSCISQGIFLKALGEEKVTPIPKNKGANKNPKDWRPIGQKTLKHFPIFA